ncbi:MAG TPA: molybdopterin-dependent oxidoreductase [Acidobacteriota bacterium]|nr:molybdopterin-dependent oxidoreductase [Acidobacteriota bacterium]
MKLTNEAAKPSASQRNINRRHLLKFVGGSALGTLFTPLPWKVLDDATIWTQNWSWIPVPPRGETIIRYTTCGLCPAGCGVRVRCIGSQPISLTGLPDQPIGRSALCPGGLVAHHLPYHPGRVSHPLRIIKTQRGSEVRQIPVDQALEAISQTIADVRSDSSAGRVAILDMLPGRSVSLVYREFLSKFSNGVYLAPVDDTQHALTVFAGIAGKEYSEFGVDLEQARTVVSFGTDLMEGWGAPGRVSHLLDSWEDGGRLIQIEPRYSKTAAMADSWLPVKPGSEPILALSLAAVIVNEKLYPPEVGSLVAQIQGIPEARTLLDELTPERAAQACGIDPQTIVTTAREIVRQTPALALIGGAPGESGNQRADHLAIGLLNLLMGAVGRAGGVVPRRSLPAPAVASSSDVPVTRLAGVPDRSIRLLMIDASSLGNSIPASLIEAKLAEKSLVVTFSSFQTGYSSISDYILPTPLYLESLMEVPTASDSPVASYALSAPLLTAPADSLTPLEYLGRAASQAVLDWSAPDAEALIESRIQAVWETQQGTVFVYSEETTKPLTDFASAADLAQALREGACWYDSPVDLANLKLSGSPYLTADTWDRLRSDLDQRIEVTSAPASSLVLMPFGTSFMATLASPLTGKLTSESRLYPQAGDAFISPSDAARLGVREGERAEIETARGRLPVCMRIDSAIMPGLICVPIVEVPVSAAWSDPRTLCEVGKDGAWRGTPASIRRLNV